MTVKCFLRSVITSEETARGKGYAGVVLYTSEHAPASKFYENNGFKLSQGNTCGGYYDKRL